MVSRANRLIWLTPSCYDTSIRMILIASDAQMYGTDAPYLVAMQTFQAARLTVEIGQFNARLYATRQVFFASYSMTLATYSTLYTCDISKLQQMRAQHCTHVRLNSSIDF